MRGRRPGILAAMVTLRVLTTDDWPLWRELRLAALTDAPQAFKVRLADWDRGEQERWRARLAMPGAHHLAALLDDDRPVGMASGLPGDGGVTELRSVWVDSGARGHGIGGRLIAAVEARAREAGAVALRLAVLAGNEPAIALYRRHGFDFVDGPAGKARPARDAAAVAQRAEIVMAKALRAG